MRSLLYTNPLGGSVLFGSNLLVITSLQGLDFADINVQEQKAPFQDGSTPIDQLFQPRSIVIQGSILVAQNLAEIDAQKRLVIAALNPKAGPGSAVYTNNLRSYALRNLVPKGSLFSNKDLTSPFQAFQVTLYCHDPYLYDLAAITDSLAVGTTNCVNSGDISCDLVLTINGPCTNPTITNTLSGYSIAYSGSIASGQSLVVNTSFGNKFARLYSGSSFVNAMPSIAAGSVFFGLELGNNPISLSVGSGTPVVTLAHTNRYLGA